MYVYFAVVAEILTSHMAILGLALSFTGEKKLVFTVSSNILFQSPSWNEVNLKKMQRNGGDCFWVEM